MNLDVGSRWLNYFTFQRNGGLQAVEGFFLISWAAWTFKKKDIETIALYSCIIPRSPCYLSHLMEGGLLVNPVGKYCSFAAMSIESYLDSRSCQLLQSIQSIHQAPLPSRPPKLSSSNMAGRCQWRAGELERNQLLTAVQLPSITCCSYL